MSGHEPRVILMYGYLGYGELGDIIVDLTKKILAKEDEVKFSQDCFNRTNTRRFSLGINLIQGYSTFRRSSMTLEELQDAIRKAQEKDYYSRLKRVREGILREHQKLEEKLTEAERIGLRPELKLREFPFKEEEPRVYLLGS